MMYKIAKNVPNRKFLVVGETDSLSRRYYTALRGLKNVEIFPYKIDMKEAYRKARLLVSPVKWYEPFGRTPAEAMVSGIPSIVPNKGGLPEVVGNSGGIIKDSENLEEWIKEIKKYDDKRYYEKKSRLCKKRVKKFSLEKQYKKLKRILKVF
ncbi:hypothetical protein ES703_24398 [subsurface metagenome]